MLSLADVEAIDDDEATAEEQEEAEETAVDLATAAGTIAELRLEIETLRRLETSPATSASSAPTRSGPSSRRSSRTRPR